MTAIVKSLGSMEVENRLMIWGIVLLLMIIVGGIVVVTLRKLLLDREAAGKNDCFDLERLEQLRADGELSLEEFRRLRNIALGLDAPKTEKPEPTLSAPANPDDE
jgi:hypothetical protein